MIIPSIVHQLEYHRLALLEDEPAAIYAWAHHFVVAREAGLLDHCRQLLLGIKGAGLTLSPHSQATLLRCRALLAQIQEEHENAIGCFQRSLTLFLQTDDAFNASRVLNDLGTIYQARGEFGLAIDCYRQALARFLPRWAGTPEAAMMHNNLGTALTEVGEQAEGVDELEAAAQLYRQLALPQAEARVLTNLGRQYRRRGEMARALTVYQEALRILQLFNDRRVQVDVLNSLGVVYRYLGQLEEALDYYTHSLDLAQQVNDLDGQAQALNNLGTIYQLQGCYDQAQSAYQAALGLHETLGDVSGQARGWGNLGYLQSLVAGQEQAGLASHQRALALYQQVQDKLGEAGALINLGTVYRHVGRYAEAETLYQQAYAIGVQEQNIRLQDFALGAWGTLRMMQERWAEAETLFQQTLALQKQRGDLHAQVETIYKLGLLAYRRGQYDAVLAIIEPGWELAFAHAYGRWLHNIAWLMGMTFEQQGKIGAFNYYATALVIALQYDLTQRYQACVTELTNGIERLVHEGEHAAALDVCNQLLGQLRQEAWAEWSAPTIEHFENVLQVIIGRRGNNLHGLRQ